MSKFCYLYLTCGNTVEANQIVQALLEKRLIVCAKQMPVESNFHWQGKIDRSEEILMIMESRLDLFDAIEKEVSKLHSYDTFVLEAVEIAKISQKAKKWMNKELKEEK